MSRRVLERRRSAWAVRSASAVVAIFTVIGGLFTAGAAAAQTPLTVQSAPASIAAATIRPTTLVGFTPGNIISDAVFFDWGSMSESQIQSFLNGKVAVCRAGYVCLKDFRQSTYTRPASPMCPGTYTGEGNEPASRIVAKVAQACGINPQVLLTTLQKEQGLVTHTWPSDWRYTIAMGQGCPDTSACDTKYYGFFNQVYGAASQFKRYANPPGTSQYFTWYAPGKTWNVRYHPNVDCGSSPVFIQNQATANLYYYTPYQPNGAALAAGYREASDPCSSYGNRNFYNYFTDWFGSTQQSRSVVEISTAYTRYGGPAGRLGTSLGSVACGLVDGGCYQGFQGGEIHWSPSTGAFATFGAISKVWRGGGSERGPLGYPVGEETCGLLQGGCYQQFQGGFIHSTPATGTHAISGEFAGVWARADYERGPLGYPAGDRTCGLPQGGCYQQFQGGFIHSTPATGTHAISGEFAGVWARADYERGPLGYPAGDRTCGLPQGGCYQQFQGGFIHSTPATGTHAISGEFAGVWARADYERGPLGYPAGDRTCGLPQGGCYQQFQGGFIHSTPATGTHAISGEFAGVWARADYERGPLGYPAGDRTCGLPQGGCHQQFQGGFIHSTPATGTHATWGAIGDLWRSLGAEASRLRYPTDGVRCGLVRGGCYQTFQNGMIHWSPATGAHSTQGAIIDAWAATDWERGPFGYPTAEAECDASARCTQRFEGGVLP